MLTMWVKHDKILWPRKDPSWQVYASSASTRWANWDTSLRDWAPQCDARGKSKTAYMSQELTECGFSLFSNHQMCTKKIITSSYVLTIPAHYDQFPAHYDQISNWVGAWCRSEKVQSPP